MSTLEERLDQIRTASLGKIPEAAKAIMARATGDLRHSGIMDRIPKVGDSLVPFELPDTSGALVTSASLLAKGPLILTIYRGVW